MKKNKTTHLGIQTRAVHAGEFPDPNTGATIPNIVMATTYKTGGDAGFSVLDQDFDGEPDFVYTRWGNPTLHQLSEKLADLEGAETCVLFGSGMAAISTLLIHVLRAGDHLVMSDVSYAGASELANEILVNMGIEITRVNTSQPENVANAMRSETKLVYIETPVNPLCRLTDISTIARIAHDGGAKLAIDSTFASPIATQPLNLGADFVVHSLTKFIGGHGDAMGGALLGNRASLMQLHQSATVRLGGIMSPFNAWLVMRGMATLPLRMKAHQENALEVANYLENHPKITQVIYPGLPSHPQHELARRQMSNFSGMMQFQVKDGPKATRIFAEQLKIFHYAVSLGHHKSLIFYLSTAEMLESSFWLTPEQEKEYRNWAGEGIFRVSVGIENAEDLIADLENALNLL